MEATIQKLECLECFSEQGKAKRPYKRFWSPFPTNRIVFANNFWKHFCLCLLFWSSSDFDWNVKAVHRAHGRGSMFLFVFCFGVAWPRKRQNMKNMTSQKSPRVVPTCEAQRRRWRRCPGELRLSRCSAEMHRLDQVQTIWFSQQLPVSFSSVLPFPSICEDELGQKLRSSDCGPHRFLSFERLGSCFQLRRRHESREGELQSFKNENCFYIVLLVHIYFGVMIIHVATYHLSLLLLYFTLF